MLLYPAMKDLLKNVPSRYLLVNLVAARARKISSLAEQEGIHLEEKPVTMAIEEVANGTLRLDNAQVSDGSADSETAEDTAPAEESGQSEAQVEPAQTMGE